MPEQNKNSASLENLLGLDDLSNLWGALQPEIRKRLIAVFKNPTEKTWNNACSIILRWGGGVHLTLWQAWIATDENAPRVGPASTLSGKRSKWATVATSEQVFMAIRYAALAARSTAEAA